MRESLMAMGPHGPAVDPVIASDAGRHAFENHRQDEFLPAPLAEQRTLDLPHGDAQLIFIGDPIIALGGMDFHEQRTGHADLGATGRHEMNDAMTTAPTDRQQKYSAAEKSHAQGRSSTGAYTSRRIHPIGRRAERGPR